MLADCSTRGYSFYLSAREMPSLRSRYREWYDGGGVEPFLAGIPRLAEAGSKKTRTGRESLSGIVWQPVTCRPTAPFLPWRG